MSWDHISTCNSMQAIMQQLLPVYLQPVREGRVQLADKGAAQHLYAEAKSHVQASHLSISPELPLSEQGGCSAFHACCSAS